MTINRKIVGIGLVAAITAFGLSGIHSVAGQASSGTMTVVVENAPSDLDPASSYDENSNIPLRAAYEGLVTLKGDSLSDVVPVLAEKIDDQNNQHQVFTFTLHSGVKFHDGTPFDATAAKFGINRTVTLNLGPGAILGTFLTAPDKQIQVVDPLTLRVTFDRPQPFFLVALAASYGTGFVSPTAVQQHTVNDSSGNPDNAHAWLQTHEAGTGPYMLAPNSAMPSVQDMNSGTPLTMQRFQDYWQGWNGSHFDKVVVQVLPESGLRRQALEQGKADAATVMLPADIIRLQKEGGYQFADAKNTLRVDFLVMAAGYGPLQDVRARQAMCYAFDYTAYNRGELGGLGSQPNGPFPSTLLGWNSNAPKCQTDLKKAVDLLKQAGVAPGTTLTYAAQEGRGDIAGAILKQQLEQIGLQVNIVKYNFDDYNNLLTDTIKPGRPDFFLQTWWPDYNSPLNFAFPLFYSKSAGASGQNAGYYSDPTVDKIIDQAQQTSDQNTLLNLFQNFQEQVTTKDPAGIFMAQSPDRTVVSPTIKNQVFNALYLGTFDFYSLSR